MILYVLTKTYYKNSNPASTLHTNTLLLTTKRAIMEQRLQEEHTTMVKFLREVMECPEDRIQSQGIPSTQSPHYTPAGYYYTHSNFTAFLTVNTIDLEKQTEDTAPLKPGDYATLKEDAIAYCRTKSGFLYELGYAKLVYIKTVKNTNKIATVSIRASEGDNNIGNTGEVPLDFLKRIQI